MALQLWEALKEAITVYTGLSPATFFTVIALALAVYHVASGLFGSSDQHQRPREEESQPHHNHKPLFFSLTKMNLFKNLPISFYFLVTLFIALAQAARFDITNNCPYTVWAAAVPGGGRQLNSHQSWPLDVNAGTAGARIWARTGCSFDGSGHGSCQTGDCGGLLQCQAYGSPPNTLAEFALNQFQNKDFVDISLVDGFNVPMEFSATSGGGCIQDGMSKNQMRCTADIIGQCPP